MIQDIKEAIKKIDLYNKIVFWGTETLFTIYNGKKEINVGSFAIGLDGFLELWDKGENEIVLDPKIDYQVTFINPDILKK